jgi:cytochrome b pre-mRNA-processing protein 3
MRESGVGDLGVGKRIRKMAQAFYGRAAAYDEALGKAAPARASKAVKARLAEVLTRNLYPDTPEQADAEKMSALGSYFLELEKQLAKRSLEDILAGHVFEL